MYGCKPQLPIDILFGLTSPQSEDCSHNKLWWCYELTNKHQLKESAHQKQQYNWKMRASKVKPGDLCLVQQKAFGRNIR